MIARIICKLFGHKWQHVFVDKWSGDRTHPWAHDYERCRRCKTAKWDHFKEATTNE